jgi:hypothetical protein
VAPRGLTKCARSHKRSHCGPSIPSCVQRVI